MRFNGYQGFHVPVGTKYTNKFALYVQLLEVSLQTLTECSQSNRCMPQHSTCRDCLSFDVGLFGSVFKGVSDVSGVQGGVIKPMTWKF
jgi:hypothetical protein